MKGFHEVRAQQPRPPRRGNRHHPPRGAAPCRPRLPDALPRRDVVARLSRRSTAASTSVDGWAAERAFLPDDVDAWRAGAAAARHLRGRDAGRRAAPSSRSRSPTSSSSPGCSTASSSPGCRSSPPSAARSHPLVVAGGPLTFSNPLPLGAFVDVVVLGEAEELAAVLLAAVAAEPDRARAARRAWRAPTASGCRRSTASACRRSPRRTTRSCRRARTVLTPNTELRSMFLIEPERGCSRGCTYCVMRRSTNGGMRMVAPDARARRHPRRRAPRRPGRRGGDRSSADRRDRAPPRRRRARGRHLVAARRSARPTSSSACSRAAAIAR